MMMKTTIAMRERNPSPSALGRDDDDDRKEPKAKDFGAVARYCAEKSSSRWTPLQICIDDDADDDEEDEDISVPEVALSDGSIDDALAAAAAGAAGFPTKEITPRSSFDNDDRDVRELAKTTTRSLRRMPSEGLGGVVDPAKENDARLVNVRDDARRQRQLPRKKRTPSKTPLSRRSSKAGEESKRGAFFFSPDDEKRVFRNKGDSERRRSRSCGIGIVDSSPNENTNKKKNRGGDENENNDGDDDEEVENLRLKLAKSRRRISGLQDELKQKDEQLGCGRAAAVEKAKELEEMSEFMTSLQDLLREMGETMGCEGEHDDGSDVYASLFADRAGRRKELDGELRDTKCSRADESSAADDREDERRRQEASSKEREQEWKIAQLIESLESQGSLMKSLERLNVDYERTVSSLTQLVREKDQALAEMEHYADMNECANDKLLNHASERHREAMEEARTEHRREVAQLLLDNSASSAESAARQTSTIANDSADRKLQEERANAKRHEEDLREAELRARDLHRVLRTQLREKRAQHEELALLQLRAEDERETRVQYVEEAKFALAAVLILAVASGGLVLLLPFATFPS